MEKGGEESRIGRAFGAAAEMLFGTLLPVPASPVI
jgi:hypothetical protein